MDSFFLYYSFPSLHISPSIPLWLLLFAFLSISSKWNVPLMEPTTGAELLLSIFGHMEANVSKKCTHKHEEKSRKDKMRHKKLASQQLPSKPESEAFFVHSFVYFIMLRFVVYIVALSTQHMLESIGNVDSPILHWDKYNTIQKKAKS